MVCSQETDGWCDQRGVRSGIVVTVAIMRFHRHRRWWRWQLKGSREMDGVACGERHPAQFGLMCLLYGWRLNSGLYFKWQIHYPGVLGGFPGTPYYKSLLLRDKLSVLGVQGQYILEGRSKGYCTRTSVSLIGFKIPRWLQLWAVTCTWSNYDGIMGPCLRYNNSIYSPFTHTRGVLILRSSRCNIVHYFVHWTTFL